MKKIVITSLFVFGMALLSGSALTSCSSSAHCPAVAGTGNSAVSSHRASKKYCAGVKGTGTIKPKQKNRIEDGNFSKKVERQLAKSKNADPIQQKTLEVK